MSDFFAAYRPLIELFLLHTGYAFSQYIVLRAGVFSVANAGLAAIGAYLSAILTLRYGVPVPLSILAAIGAGIGCALLLSWPLARLRGVYQAIATLAFVQIVLSLNLFAENLTGGAMGLNGIPKAVGMGWLAVAVVIVIGVMLAINRTRIGRAFEAVRQDEAMAASLGISVRFHQALAFAVSGAIAGLFGALEAFHSYALEPNQFGFAFLVAGLSYVVLGGRRSVWGPLVGTAVLIALPELARPLADNRILVYGVLLMAVINFMPRGIVDTFLGLLHRRRMANAEAQLAEARS